MTKHLVQLAAALVVALSVVGNAFAQDAAAPTALSVPQYVPPPPAELVQMVRDQTADLGETGRALQEADARLTHLENFRLRMEVDGLRARVNMPPPSSSGQDWYLSLCLPEGMDRAGVVLFAAAGVQGGEGFSPGIEGQFGPSTETGYQLIGLAGSVGYRWSHVRLAAVAQPQIIVKSVSEIDKTVLAVGPEFAYERPDDHPFAIVFRGLAGAVVADTNRHGGEVHPAAKASGGGMFLFRWYP